MPALTKADLDALVATGCSVPGCTRDHTGESMFFDPKCHSKVGAGVEVSYLAGSGVVRVRCQICHKVVIEVRVSEGTSAGPS